MGLQLFARSIMGGGLLLLLTSGALAQRLHYSTPFNPATCITVSGEVSNVEHAYSERGDDYCQHALVSTPAGVITVILAPQEYMEKANLTLTRGDRLTIRGSLITVLDRPFLLATDITGDRQMRLRDKQGRPVWLLDRE